MSNQLNAHVREQQADVAAGINLVEIDLVRQGHCILAASEALLPEDDRGPYLVCVYRDEEVDQVELYRAPLHARLPNIRVPLRSGESDAVLQLQGLVDECYRDGRYYRTNYGIDPQPPLTGEDLTWADRLLRERGRRG